MISRFQTQQSTTVTTGLPRDARLPMRPGVSQLLRHLRSEQRLNGLHFERGPTGSAIVQHGGHVRGMWHARSGCFSYTPAGHVAPVYHADTVEQAVNVTLRLMDDLRS